MSEFSLLPTSTELSTNWSIVGSPAPATHHEAVDDPIDSQNGLTDYVTYDGVSGDPIRFGLIAPPSLVSVQSVRVVFWAWYGNPETFTVRAGLRIGGTNYWDTGITITTSVAKYETAKWLTNPDTGDAWTEDDLASVALIFEKETSGDASANCTSIYLLGEGVIVPSQASIARQVASTRLAGARHLTPTYRLTTELDSDIRIGHVVDAAHALGLSPDGTGWPDSSGARQTLAVVGERFDPLRFRRELRVVDVMQSARLYSLWNLSYTRHPHGAVPQGGAYSDVGATIAYTRDSDAWFPAAPDLHEGRTRIVRSIADTRRIGRHGEYAEPSRKNHLLNSSAKDGVSTNWTVVGSVTAGSDIVFDSDVTDKNWVLDGNDALSSIEQTSQTLPQLVQFSMLYGLGVDTLDVVLQRSSDSKYWRNSDSTWQVAEVKNSLPAPGADTDAVVARSEPMDLESAGQTLTVRIEAPLGNRGVVHHVQLEENDYATSPIVTTSTAVTRAGEKLTLTSRRSPHVWPWRHGTAAIRFRVQWVSGSLPSTSTVKHLLFVSYDGAAWRDRIFYNPANGNLIWQRRMNSVSTNVQVVDPTLVRDTDYEVVIRWTSERGELGLDPFTQSIWLDGVKGTEASASRPMLPSADVALVLGGQIGTDEEEWGGMISEVLATPLVLPDSLAVDLLKGASA